MNSALWAHYWSAYVAVTAASVIGCFNEQLISGSLQGFNCARKSTVDAARSLQVNVIKLSALPHVKLNSISST